MEPRNRRQFRDYILRRLGSPVQEINVDGEQVEDRIDDALSFFQEYHYLGSEQVVYVHELTEEDVRNENIPIPENIIEVSSMAGSSGGLGGGSGDLTNPRYHMAMDALSGLSGNSLVPYFIAMNRISDVQWMFENTASIQFNRHKNVVEFPASLKNTSLRPGSKVALNGYAVIDPKEYADIWKDRWLKTYATALVKRQWGENLKKYTGVQLLGGIQLDGKTIYDEAVEEIRNLEERMINSFSVPILDQIA